VTRPDNSLADAGWLIDTDAHVIEPAHVWVERVPKRFGDAVPHVRRDDEGDAFWFEGRRLPITGLAASSGRRKEDFSPKAVRYEEILPGTYDPIARVGDMNVDGVLSQLVFPMFPGHAGTTFLHAKDRELAGYCVRAYNDWMIDDWCGAAPGRYIPLIILPLWDPSAAVAEIERCTAKGAKAVSFPENPAYCGLPSLYDADGFWDPVMAAADRANLPICTHIGTSKVQRTASDCPTIVSISLAWETAVECLLDWLYSGLFYRWPNLKLVLSEGGIGWIPYALEHADLVYDQERHWAMKAEYTFGQTVTVGGSERGTGRTLVMEEPPSALFRRNVYGCVIDEVFGTGVIQQLGSDRIMLETDYPHASSSWPESIQGARTRLKHLSDEDRYLVMQGNARRVFSLDAVPTTIDV
jgi:predicted TIM-barrel fold metal-dependent hydrolase